MYEPEMREISLRDLWDELKVISAGMKLVAVGILILAIRCSGLDLLREQPRPAHCAGALHATGRGVAQFA